MFRFKQNILNKLANDKEVSIHPMFRFKIDIKKSFYLIKVKFQYILCFGSRLHCLLNIIPIKFVSIHPMFRFKFKTFTSKINIFSMFQYILCFGSSKSLSSASSKSQLFQYILCFGSRVLFQRFLACKLQFQYILCFGSSQLVVYMFVLLS